MASPGISQTWPHQPAPFWWLCAHVPSRLLSSFLRPLAAGAVTAAFVVTFMPLFSLVPSAQFPSVVFPLDPFTGPLAPWPHRHRSHSCQLQDSDHRSLSTFLVLLFANALFPQFGFYHTDPSFCPYPLHFAGHLSSVLPPQSHPLCDSQMVAPAWVLLDQLTSLEKLQPYVSKTKLNIVPHYYLHVSDYYQRVCLSRVPGNATPRYLFSQAEM